MEPRCLLSASPINLGMVYYEEASGFDEQGDVFHLTFEGGAPGTQLTQLTIETDKLGDGLQIGDCFFDTAPGGLGAFGSAGLVIVSQEGVDSVEATVEDGGTTLTFQFQGFEAGDRLVFTIDVDEMGFLGPNAVAEGNEFEGSQLHGVFQAPHYYDAAGNDLFLDHYNANLQKTTLDLPPDNYMPPANTPHPVRTAAAVFSLQQEPLPASLGGTVFHDGNMDLQQDTGEEGLAGVSLELFRRDGDRFVSTGMTTVTDANGRYQFDDLLPGEYRVLETQPAGYLSVGATAGIVEGSTRGTVLDADTISGVTLAGGEDSVENNFAEVRPAGISGHVFHDADNDGVFDADETGIGGVTVIVTREADPLLGEQTYEVTTAADGSWSVSDLMPGEYHVAEAQPHGYFDGLDSAGTAGGRAENPGDTITGVTLASGQLGQEYNFGELLPASISGRVLADDNANCQYDPGEQWLANVTIELLDANQKVIATTTTDNQGQYTFEGLRPGVYGVREIQPEGYFDGNDHVGSAGGVLAASDLIVSIPLGSDVDAVHYDFCEIRPAGLSGYVYEDMNTDGRRNPGESGISGVTLRLLNADGSETGQTTVTDAAGYFEFDNLRPGTYTIVEEQPEGYFDGTDATGTAGGTAINPGDRIEAIKLMPGTFGEDYLFGEYPPVMVSGRVFADNNGNDRIDAGDEPLEGVTIHLLDASGARIASTTTNDQGLYRFENLEPGLYGIEERQPEGLLDGPDFLGNAGGRFDGNDRVTNIKLPPGTKAVGYDFLEVRPASISGYVFQDGPVIRYTKGEEKPDVFALRDGQFTPDDTPLAGVEIQLRDAAGEAILDEHGNPIVTRTDANGYYEFSGLRPAVYSLYQVQPAGYVDGPDTPGTLGGVAVNPNEPLEGIDLNRLAADPNYDAILGIVAQAGAEGTQYNFAEVRMEETIPYVPPPEAPTPEPPPAPQPQPIYSQTPPPVLVVSPVAPDPIAFPPIGGGGEVTLYTWHLSVINGGNPRHPNDGFSVARSATSTYFTPARWEGAAMDRGEWLIDDYPEARQIDFGTEGALPVVGDFNGDGVADVGVFLAGSWFIDLNGNGEWDEGDLWMELGKDGDRPVTGDWDGDGKTDIGIFGRAWPGDEEVLRFEPGLPDAQNDITSRPKNMPPKPQESASDVRLLQRGADGRTRADVIDHVFQYGRENDQPVTGDWNGDGIATIGVFRGGTWYLDVDGDGRWSNADVVVPHFGEPGDTAVPGDFNGDGKTDLGLFRDGMFILDSNGNRVQDAHDRVLALGAAGDMPIAADFNGDGIDQVGVFRYRLPGAEGKHAETSSGDSYLAHSPGMSQPGTDGISWRAAISTDAGQTAVESPGDPAAPGRGAE